MESRRRSKYKDWPQILALGSAAIASFSCGNLFSFPSPAIPKLLKGEYNFTIEQASYLTVVSPIAMMIASPLFCYSSDKFGRKYTLLVIGLVHIISWLIVAFAKSIYLFYLSRLFAGFGDAILFSALPAYIAEVCTPKIRGTFGNALIVGVFGGQFSINAVGYYLSIKLTGFVMLIFPIMFLGSFVFMPKTPYYLIMTGDEVGAEKSLQWLRGCDDVQDELKQLIIDVQRQLSESGTIKDLWKIKSNRKALIIANITRAIQQFSGISVFAVYVQYIFIQAGGDISSGHASMIFTGILAFVNTFANLVSDKLGRKLSMVISCIGSGISLLGETIYFYLREYTSVDVNIVNWFPVFGLVLYVFVFSVGLGVVPTLMLGEIFSASIRRYATMVSNIMFGVYMCGITKLFQVMVTAYGLCIPFFFLTLCCFAGAVISYFLIPETKGKTLEEIQQMLKGNKVATKS